MVDDVERINQRLKDMADQWCKSLPTAEEAGIAFKKIYQRFNEDNETKEDKKNGFK